MRAAMRQDPDVILVGEMRDHETVKAGLAAAETGHFVMSTLHTTDAAETINRIIDFFPPHEQKQVRLALAASLRGIICQRLVPRADGEGRCVVMEIAVNTGRIADAIADPDKTSTISQLISEGSYYGMQTFDQHLVSFIRDGVVTMEAAMAASTWCWPSRARCRCAWPQRSPSNTCVGCFAPGAGCSWSSIRT
jgi:twitching motility protein PilT